MGDMVRSSERPPSQLAVYKAETFFERVGLTNEWEKEKVFALQAIQASDQLSKCSPDSIVKAMANVALTGLSLDPSRKLAFLIPRGGVCVLQPSYRGLIKSVTSTGAVIAFEAKVVYEGDHFEYEEGSAPFIKHQSLDLAASVSADEAQLLVTRRRTPFESMRCAYSVAVLPGGVRTFVIVPKWRIEKARAVAKGTDNHSSPWKQWPEEQIRKTVLAYHTKTLDVGESAAAAVQLFHDNDGLDKEKQINTLSDEQAAEIDALLLETGSDVNGFLAAIGVKSLFDIPVSRYKFAVTTLEDRRNA
jgi:phage RecT family recombinase